MARTYLIETDGEDARTVPASIRWRRGDPLYYHGDPRMTDRESPPPSWYEPANDPAPVTLACRVCDTEHDADAPCPDCGTRATVREVMRAHDSLREDRV